MYSFLAHYHVQLLYVSLSLSPSLSLSLSLFFESDVIVVTDLLPEPVGGTSCAAPTVGAVIGLLNNERLKAGKKTLGFLNPLIYAAGSGSFHPLRKGCNKGCSQKGMGFCASGKIENDTKQS